MFVCQGTIIRVRVHFTRNPYACAFMRPPTQPGLMGTFRATFIFCFFVFCLFCFCFRFYLFVFVFIFCVSVFLVVFCLFLFTIIKILKNLCAIYGCVFPRVYMRIERQGFRTLVLFIHVCFYQILMKVFTTC